MLSLSGLAIASAAHDRYAALPIIPEGLTPRYSFDRSQPLLKRDGNCGDNSHPCKATAPLLLLLMQDGYHHHLRSLVCVAHR